MEKTKICTRCGEAKTLDQFHALKKGAHGRHPRCKACRAIYMHDRNKANPTTRQTEDRNAPQRWRKQKYGLSPEAYDALLESQAGGCAICRARGRLVVDHDHNTGRIRGLLCTRCNTGLGKLGDSVEGLELALAYLRARC